MMLLRYDENEVMVKIDKNCFPVVLQISCLEPIINEVNKITQNTVT